MLEWIISSAVLLAAVIAVRYALRGRLRPGVQYAMWAIVLVRLLVPVSFGSGAYSAGTAAAALEQTPAVQAVLTPSMDYDAAYSQVAREYAGRGLDGRKAGSPAAAGHGPGDPGPAAAHGGAGTAMGVAGRYGRHGSDPNGDQSAALYPSAAQPPGADPGGAGCRSM